MRLTYRQRGSRFAVELANGRHGRKAEQLKVSLRKVIRSVSGEAKSIAVFLCPVKTGLMRRMIKVEFTAERLAFNLGWRRRDFRERGKPFYPPWVVEGTSRQSAQDPLRPAFRRTDPILRRECTLVFRAWAKAA